MTDKKPNTKAVLDEILKEIVAPEHPWFNPGKAIQTAKAKIEQLYVLRDAEHYFSHKGKLQSGYADLYFCACGKYDKDRDRLLRHIHWHELKLNDSGADF